MRNWALGQAGRWLVDGKHVRVAACAPPSNWIEPGPRCHLDYTALDVIRGAQLGKALTPCVLQTDNLSFAQIPVFCICTVHQKWLKSLGSVCLTDRTVVQLAVQFVLRLVGDQVKLSQARRTKPFSRSIQAGWPGQSS